MFSSPPPTHTHTHTRAEPSHLMQKLSETPPPRPRPSGRAERVAVCLRGPSFRVFVLWCPYGDLSQVFGDFLGPSDACFHVWMMSSPHLRVDGSGWCHKRCRRRYAPNLLRKSEKGEIGAFRCLERMWAGVAVAVGGRGRGHGRAWPWAGVGAL